ncbi:MAG: BrnT family toxin [Spirochaetales bacterium]
MEFEYDPAKSNANARKQGIDFETAHELWQDNGLIVLPSRFAEKTRFLAVGKIEEKHWTAIFTERGECIRLISVRRSRTEEKGHYERNR